MSRDNTGSPDRDKAGEYEQALEDIEEVYGPPSYFGCEEDDIDDGEDLEEDIDDRTEREKRLYRFLWAPRPQLLYAPPGYFPGDRKRKKKKKDKKK